MAEKELLCQPERRPHIAVVIQDEDGAGVPGVEVWLTWPGGADRAVTGLKPQIGPGYADFDVKEGIGYAIGVGELGLPLVSDLELGSCVGDEGERFIGSWRLVISPPHS